MSRKLLILVLVSACCALFPSGLAGGEPVSTNSSSESGSMPKSLPPRLREKLAKMQPAERQKLIERWQQLRSLSPEARKLLNRNFQSFRKMPPEQREQLKQRLQQWQNMSPEEKQRLQENFQRWKQLSPQEREELRKRQKRSRSTGGEAPSDGSLAPAAKSAPAAVELP